MSDFRKRLYDLEIAPSLNVWEKITAALDEPAFPEKLSSKLYDLQINPPSQIWKKISSTLDSDESLPVPFIKKIKPYYKYAGAAILIGLMIFTISLFMSKKNEANVEMEQSSLPNKQLLSPGNTHEKNFETAFHNENTRNEKKQYATHSRSANIEQSIQKKLLTLPNHSSTPADLQTNFSVDELKERSKQLTQTAREDIDYHGDYFLNRYVTLLRPDGYIIRMSRKFAGMIGCIYNSPSLNENEDCKDQLNKWREKIAKSPLIPSPDNFMDILTLIKYLQEE